MHNSDCIKLDIDEVEECSVCPRCSDVEVKPIARNTTREGGFLVFSLKEQGEHPVASNQNKSRKWRWDDWKPQEEKAWKGRQGLEEEDKRKWHTAFEHAASMLKYLEDNEDVKVGLRELKEQLEMLEEASISVMQIAKQARNERGQKIFQIFRQEENEVYIVSSARWVTQLKRLVELERRCQDLMQEVKLPSERQEVLAGLVEDKSGLQSSATEKYFETIFEEMRELEEKQSKEEALVLV